MNNNSFNKNFFPVSVWYSGGKARAPMLSGITQSSKEQWRHDLEQIKELGFNTIRTWIEWAHSEPIEGEFDFDNLILLSELASEIDLKIFIQMYADSAPDWVGKKFPDALFEAQNGAKIPSQAAPGYCIDNSEVCEAIKKFYSETARVAIQFPNFFGWDLWSEPHIVNWVVINHIPDVQFCYCPYTKKKFQEWLINKYHDLKELNRAWYRNFEKWEDIEPPRFGTILSYTDFIDWKNFIYYKMASDLKIRAEAIRKVDKDHIITSHAAVPSIFYSPFVGYGPTDDYLMAEQVDYYGTSIYPKHSFPDRHWERWKIQIAMDFSRSANIKNGGFYVGELQAGFGARGVVVGDPVTSEDHRIWFWSALAKSAKGINFYAYYPMSSGYESGGYGLINLDGTLTERSKETGNLARIVSENSELFINSIPIKSEIGLLYSTLGQMVGGEQNCGPQNGLRDSLAGYFRVFVDNNIPVDFVHLRNLEEKDYSQYKMLIIPYPMMLSKKAAEGLMEFIKNGGAVLSEARLAWNDENGFSSEIIPGMGLNEVFGVREETVKMSNEVAMRISNNKHVAMSNLLPADILKGAWFAESLSAIGNKADVLALFEDDSPCIISNSFGKGKTIFIGTFFGLGLHQYNHPINNIFLLNLLNWANIDLPLKSSHDGNTNSPVEIRLQKNTKGLLLFVINHSKTLEDIKIDLKMDKDDAYTFLDIIVNKKTCLYSLEKIVSFSCQVESKNAKVFFVEGSK